MSDDEIQPEEIAQLPVIPHIVVSLIDEKIDVNYQNLSVLAVPTLLRLAAKTVENELDL